MLFQSLRPSLVAILVVFSISLSLPVQALESLGFTDLHKRMEQLEREGAYKLTTKELAAKLNELSEDIEEFIKDNPANPDILVLSVRVGYLNEQFLTAKNVDGISILSNHTAKFDEMQKRLDNAIEQFPEYAAAYYWKGALYGMPVSIEDALGKVVQRPTDLNKAIEYARKAVELDKGNIGYRRTLAMFHFSNGDNKSALKVLDTPDMANSPERLLIGDLETLPLPYGSHFLQQDTDSYIELLIGQKSIKDYPNLRVRAFVVPLSATELGDFFRAKWPGFEFFKQQGRGDMFAQYMLPHGEGVRPSAHVGEARTWASMNMGGVVLSVHEIQNASAEQRQSSPAGQRLPDNIGDNFCYLFMLNNRVVQ
jgi:hypothetical protein